MSSPEIDQAAPSFNLPATGEQNIRLEDLAGKNVVLFFYPRDATPGCTTESQNFRDSIADFDEANAVILGISQDSVESHEKFKAKQEMPFELLSDEDGVTCKDYDVIKLKKMYGKEFMGIERSTFLIDASGVLRKSWLKVKVPGHVDEVLSAVQAL
jgi:peroxiredoxin Q/BCP